MTVRAGTHEDVDAVLALWGAERSAHAATPDTSEAVERTIAHDALLVSVEDGAIVGVLVAAFDGWRGNMYRLAVAASHRRRGIATALVRAGEDRLRAMGGGRITALVAHDDEVAVALWESAGYAADHEIGRWVRNA